MQTEPYGTRFSGRRHATTASFSDSAVIRPRKDPRRRIGAECEPFGTVFPIGLGEPWGTNSGGRWSRDPIPKSSRRAEPKIGLENNFGHERKTTMENHT
jgi:hypothetical protein